MKPSNKEQREPREKNCPDCQLRWFLFIHIQTSNHPTDRTFVLREKIWNLLELSTIWNDWKILGFHGNFTVNTTLENSNLIGWSAQDDGWKCHINGDCRSRQVKTSQYDELWNLLEYSTIWNNWKKWGLHGNSTIGTTLKNSIAIVRDKCWMKMFH